MAVPCDLAYGAAESRGQCASCQNMTGVNRKLGSPYSLGNRVDWKIMTQNQENKPKNPSRITPARGLIALFLLVLFVSWFFGWYLRRR